MCKKRAQSRSVTFPIFSILCYKNFIIISGGGVGERYGYGNQIVVYGKNEILDKPLFQLSTKEHCLDNLRVNAKTGVIIGVTQGTCFILKIDDKGTLSIVQSFVCDEAELRTCAIDNKAANIYTGGEDKILRCFEIKRKDDNTFDVNKRFDLREHTAAINYVDVSVDDDLLCSCAEDKTCRIYNARKGIQIKKLTFGEGVKSHLNLKFNFCFFHKDERHLLTIQNPDRFGDSYLTKWDMKSECEPVKTIKLHNTPITTACQDIKGSFLGVGTVDGCSKIINTRYLEIDNEVQCHDLIVKGVSFLDNSASLGSISPDSTYYFLRNQKSRGFLSGLMKIGVVVCILAYLIMILRDNFLSSNSQ